MLFHSSFCLNPQALVALMDPTANLPAKEHSDPLDEREIQLVSHRRSAGYRRFVLFLIAVPVGKRMLVLFMVAVAVTFLGEICTVAR